MGRMKELKPHPTGGLISDPKDKANVTLHPFLRWLKPVRVLCAFSVATLI